MNSGIRAVFSYALFFLFLGYHFLIDRSYRPSADDFAVTDLATQGIPGINFAVEMYLNWEGPFLGMTLLGLVCWLASVTAPWVPLMVVKAAMLLSSTALLKTLGNEFKFNWRTTDALGMATALTMGLYLIAPNQPEIWHWLVGTPYLSPLVFIGLGVAALVRGRLLIAIIPFAFVMQSRATYALLIFGLLFLVSSYSILKGVRRKEWSIFISVTLAFLIIYLVAPGNYARMSEHGNTVVFLVSQFKTGLHNLFISYNLAKMDRIMLAVVGSYFFVGQKGATALPSKTWQWLVPIALYLSFAIGHGSLFVMVTGYCEWTRVLSLHSYLFLTICMIYGFWTGTKAGIVGHGWTRKIALGMLVVLGGYMVKDMPAEFEKAEQFKTTYDQRMETIMKHSGKGDTLFVEPLQYNGKLYFDDFSSDPDYWINKDFRKAYDLPFKVATKRN